MAFLNERGLLTLWKNIWEKFGTKTEVSAGQSIMKLTLKSGSDAVLDETEIPTVTPATIGLMTKDDKIKLDSIEHGATASSGTVKIIKGVKPIKAITNDTTVTLKHEEITASGIYGGSNDTQIPLKFGESFKGLRVEIDKFGHVTKALEPNIVIPSSVASTTTDGLMSKEDKSKLNDIDDHATANLGTITSIQTSSPLTGGANSGAVLIKHNKTDVTPGIFGQSTDKTVALNESFLIPKLDIDDYGHIKSAKSVKIKFNLSEASASTPGLMSIGDKQKVDLIELNDVKSTSITLKTLKEITSEFFTSLEDNSVTEWPNMSDTTRSYVTVMGQAVYTFLKKLNAFTPQSITEKIEKLINDVNASISKTTINKPNGVAGLNSQGKLASIVIPDSLNISIITDDKIDEICV